LDGLIAPAIAVVKRFPIWTGIGAFALVGFVFHDFLSGNVGDLKVGDCFDAASLTTTDAIVKDVQHHPCSDAHGGEVFFIGNVAARANSAYPAEETFTAFVRDQCLPAYSTYTGRDFDSDTTYDFQWLTPTPSGWARGDRAIDCFVLRVDGQVSKGSVRASR
jgi:hypothetical protein